MVGLGLAEVLRCPDGSPRLVEEVRKHASRHPPIGAEGRLACHREPIVKAGLILPSHVLENVQAVRRAGRDRQDVQVGQAPMRPERLVPQHVEVALDLLAEGILPLVPAFDAFGVAVDFDREEAKA